MNLIFTVSSKRDVERYIPNKKSILVRIFSSSKYKDIVDLNDKYLDTLELVFDDITISPESEFWDMFNMDEEAKGLIPVNENHINDFINFVDKWGSEAEELVIHCDAGISRSPAMAIGLCYVKGWDKKELILRREFRNPNGVVLDLFEGKCN